MVLDNGTLERSIFAFCNSKLLRGRLHLEELHSGEMFAAFSNVWLTELILWFSFEITATVVESFLEFRHFKLN